MFVCENNQYGEYSRIELTTPIGDLADRAASYGMPGEIVDGQDVDAVASAMENALARARAGEGPSLLEMKTYRYAGHSRADKAPYRPEGEFDLWYEKDPINTYRRRLLDEGELTEEQATEMEAGVARRLAEAEAEAAAGEPAGVEDMFANIYAP